METAKLKNGLENLSKSKQEMQQVVEDFFRAGGFEKQMALIASSLQEVVNKGAGETCDSLDNEFEYTNRYIRESVYELTELQKFLIHLHESYRRYRRNCEYLDRQSANTPQAVRLVKLS
ncbi:hypothetical protein [Dysgonomonas sp. 25]|uniref:hypothetical protein n=1 Tax=Dysgonomonas sp. 25 TaxID=2302933 RepID=UPI0013D4FE2B|nr:hypothetical protein [Dysgonomonas sp. 25]NDV69230.1 hypothetical protein [Dysgonomonas sp. 25]